MLIPVSGTWADESHSPANAGDGTIRHVEPTVRFFQARVISLNYGIIHFLIREDEGRTPEETAYDVIQAGFLSSRFDSPLHEMTKHTELKELDLATFSFVKGSPIPSDEVSGMTFWWLK